MSNGKFDSRAMMVGFICALISLPFTIGLGALAIKLDLLLVLFSGSEWFAFKAIVGLLEIIAFGLGAAISQAHRRS